MKINTKELESILCTNLMENQYLVERPVLVESFEVSPYHIGRVLLDRSKSPYFYPLYEGAVKPNNFSFYAMCFYAFMSGVEYAVIKNGNIHPEWDYWTMHRYIGDDMSMQGLMFWRGLKEMNSMLLGISGCNDMGRKGVLAYRVVTMVIDGYFEDKGIEDFPVLDEEGYETGESVSNVSEVLSSFHRIGTVCAFQALSMCKINEEKGKEFILWGGLGMSKFLQFV